MPSIRLTKKTQTLKIVNQDDSIRLAKDAKTIKVINRRDTIRLQHNSGKPGPEGDQGTPGVVQSIVAGSNVTVNNSDPANPIVSSTGGGTNNAFFTVAGPASTAKTYTFPNANATVLTTNTVVTVAQGGSGRTTATTAYGLIAAGTTATGIHQTISPGTSGHILKSNGASALPSFSAGAKTDVGLSNVDNTSDANKPVSTATQTALDLKAPLASPTFTGTVSGVTKSHVGLGNVDNTSDATKDAATATLTNKTLTAPVINNPTGFLTGAAKITVGTSTPGSPTTGDLWIDTN